MAMQEEKDAIITPGMRFVYELNGKRFLNNTNKKSVSLKSSPQVIRLFMFCSKGVLVVKVLPSKTESVLFSVYRSKQCKEAHALKRCLLDAAVQYQG